MLQSYSNFLWFINGIELTILISKGEDELILSTRTVNNPIPYFLALQNQLCAWTNVEAVHFYWT